MRRIHSTGAAGRALASVALGAALLLSACASDSGEKEVDAPFPKLADVPPRPQASTTPEERAALRTQLERRRDEINSTAASLLRGGTEPVPVALDPQVPRAPSGTSTPPPPLPAGLPPSPERPASPAGVSGNGKQKSEKSGSGAAEKRVIEAPGEADMPPARAAGGKEEEGGNGESTPDEAQEEETGN